MKRLKLYFLFFIVASFFVACSSDDDGPSVSLTDVVVINEGNFSNADGSLSGYNRETKAVVQQLFENANNFPITATIQNVIPYNDQYFIVGNSPDKLIAVSKSNFVETNELASGSDLANPFTFTAIGDKGYIANWGTYNPSTFGFDNAFLTVISLQDFSVLKKIALDQQPQDLMIYGNQLYISNPTGNSITVLNTATDEITGSIATPFGPDRMVLDRNNKIWTICRSGALARIDPQSNEVEAIIENVVTSGFNEKLVINPAGDQLYYLATVYAPDFSSSSTFVYALGIEDTVAPGEALVVGDTFYGIGVYDNTLYVGDHNGFQGTGTVFLYDLEGNRLSEFESGIAPSGFIFNN